MTTQTALTDRFKALFGGVWQAALDEAQVISRRRARDIGGGESASASLLALLEFLETVPVKNWPARWRGLGKCSDSCPTRELFSERLVKGRIQPEDAVIVWDFAENINDKYYTNIAVGLLPTNAFRGLPKDAPERASWVRWTRQWQNFHGGGTVDRWMSSPMMSPEGMIANWLVRGKIRPSDCDAVLTLLEQRVLNFSRSLVVQLQRESEQEPEFDDEI